MSLVAPDLKETAALLHLLDDEDTEVRSAIGERLARTNGDLSHQIASLGIDLSPADRRLLCSILLPGRRQHLEREWSVPSSGLWNPSDDWDVFEHLLGLISDFLHDGIQLRPTLMDQLDRLAQELEEEQVDSIDCLRRALFTDGRFQGNHEDYYSVQNSDLCWVLEQGRGNPLSLSLVFMLVGHRFGFLVDGCNFPGHFVARIGLDGCDYLVDCYNRGELLPVDEVIRRQGSQNASLLETLNRPTSFAEILRRVLHNACFSLTRSHDKESALLLDRLATSLVP